MELSKYFDVFMAQAKVVWEAGIDFGSKIFVSLIQGKLHENDSTVLSASAYYNPLIKLEKDMKTQDLWEVVNYNTFC